MVETRKPPAYAGALRKQLREQGLSNIGIGKILFFKPVRAIPFIVSVAQAALALEQNPETAILLLKALLREPKFLIARLSELFVLELDDFGAERAKNIVEHSIIILPYFTLRDYKNP